MKTKPGEIWLADLGLAAKLRPVLILSREDADPPRALVIYAPLTTQIGAVSTKLACPSYAFCPKHRSLMSKV